MTRIACASDNAGAVDALRDALKLAEQPEAAHVLVRRFDADALEAARDTDLRRADGEPLAALAGCVVTVKDMFDVRGHPTTAASRSLFDALPATRDCTTVARLRAAGALLLGHTNMSEFAYSTIGLNPHRGTPLNPSSPAGDARIPGGSTSGGAVSVALGMARAALGSDTGGSIRIPAALQGLVGFKSTQRLVPLDGIIPLSSTLDTACAITRNVADAVTLHAVLADRVPRLPVKPISALRLGVPTTLMLDALEPVVAQAFDRALMTLRQHGANVTEVEAPELHEAANFHAKGGFAAAESWTWHRDRLPGRARLYDRRVLERIHRGAAIGTAEYQALHRARADWTRRLCARFIGFDAMLSPTLPMVAPPIQPLMADDRQFLATHLRLLRNTSIVNLFDGCALTLPCPAGGPLPVGLMLWGPALADDEVLHASLVVESLLAAR